MGFFFFCMQSSLARHLWNTLILSETVNVADEMKKKMKIKSKWHWISDGGRLLAKRPFKCGVSKMKWSSQEESFTHAMVFISIVVQLNKYLQMNEKWMHDTCEYIDRGRERIPTSHVVPEAKLGHANQQTDVHIHIWSRWPSPLSSVQGDSLFTHHSNSKRQFLCVQLPVCCTDRRQNQTGQRLGQTAQYSQKQIYPDIVSLGI